MTLAEVKHQLLGKIKKQNMQIERMKKKMVELNIEGDELVRECEQNKLSIEGEEGEERNKLDILSRLQTFKT